MQPGGGWFSFSHWCRAAAAHIVEETHLFMRWSVVIGVMINEEPHLKVSSFKCTKSQLYSSYRILRNFSIAQILIV